MNHRRVEPRDADEWVRLRFAMWPERSLREHEAFVDRYFEGDPEFATFVVERSDGRLAAFLDAAIRPFAHGCDSFPVGYMEACYVDGDVRRQGLCRGLVDAAERWARERGCSEMASDCHLGNEASEAAHAALGYEDVERLVHFRRSLESNCSR